MKVGIDRISVYVPDRFLGLDRLAEARGVAAEKYRDGLGQERMAVAPPDEDMVTMAAAAALPLLDGLDPATLDALIVGTEGGVDESKASSIYVHRLLGLPKTVKAFEVKQACCGATCALSMALNTVARFPYKRVLVIGSDVARYEPGSPGEPTQGAGAVAMLVTANPRIIALDPEWGTYTDDVMDFWRPGYRREALVDGKYSIKVYLRALSESWERYAAINKRSFADHARFCFHLPFTRMADKALAQLAKISAGAADDALIADGLRYNRITGNSYTASLFLSLASLLDHTSEDFAGGRVGFFSYGSGCMGAFFGGELQPGWREFTAPDTARHAALFTTRTPLGFDEYTEWMNLRLPEDGSELALPVRSRNRYRLAALRDHRRIYEDTAIATEAAA